MIDWLINRAKRTPYFHLNGYMNRWWLVPYNVVIERPIPLPHGDRRAARYEIVHTDGTGMVNPWRRPFTWVLQKLGIAVRVHEILRSDTGRDPHDHPWPYLTVILRGGYEEQRFDDKGNVTSVKWHGPGSILYRPAGSWHKLVLPGRQGEPCEPCTTLFITGPKAQRWGFLVDGVKVPYDRYPGRN